MQITVQLLDDLIKNEQDVLDGLTKTRRALFARSISASNGRRPTRRRMSAAGRARISAAQRARWAKTRRAKK